MSKMQTLDGMVGGAMMREAVPVRRRRTSDQIDYRLVFSVCFVIFFWALSIERLLPRQWRHLSDSARGKSLLAEAKEVAHGCAGIAFQG